MELDGRVGLVTDVAKFVEHKYHPKTAERNKLNVMRSGSVKNNILRCFFVFMIR